MPRQRTRHGVLDRYASYLLLACLESHLTLHDTTLQLTRLLSGLADGRNGGLGRADGKAGMLCRLIRL